MPRQCGVACLKTYARNGHKKPFSRGRTFNAERFQTCVCGLFYSWPVAPQQSRLRFKQRSKLGSFSLLFPTALTLRQEINLTA